jgi:hypothetical protein
MRVAALSVLCLAANAHAHPTGEELVPPAAASAPTAELEVAGTWSGNTIKPKNGWRAALLVPLSTAPLRNSVGTAGFSFIARFDDHGAPAEDGMAETNATSWGGGLRGTITWAFSNVRFGVFGEGTVGRTRSRHADVSMAQRDSHWMLSGGFVGGTRTLQVVADFGWLVTDAGDGRIGPIASLGLHLALD